MRASTAALLAGIFDYAGTFPPAGLPLEEMAANYSAALGGSHRSLVGRLVVPVASLTAIERLAAQNLQKHPWPVTAIVGGDLAVALDNVREHYDGPPHRIAIMSVEVPPIGATDIRTVKAKIPAAVEAFFEVPIDADFERRIAAIASAAAFAKVRTGGVTSAAFPTAEGLARFVMACSDAGVPFKATAGLHHTIRGCYRLTYEADSPETTMHGFLNVSAAAALAYSGAGARDVAEVLSEPSPQAFRFDDESLRWRGWEIRTRELAATRAHLFRSFGTCSVTEPIEELERLQLL